MFSPLAIHNLTELPVTSPELKFLIILAVTLFAPLLLDRLRIPHILGLIIAGALIGEHGFNILHRDSGIVLSGTAGLLYIMFLAGLEIDINEFIKNRWRSIIFGLYTFAIPLILGTLSCLYILKLPMMTSLLLASMFSTHTLLAYPILSKMGVKRNRAVTITIGGTVIAETLALLTLAIIVGLTGDDEVDATFWVTMCAKLLAFGGVIFIGFPIIGRYILKRCSDGMTQYIFILFMLFLGASLAMAAGLEGIIGALFTGLALNRLIPNSSTLMNRIEFVGNSIFIPFFLIGVGMLIDYRVFISDWNAIYTAAVMTTVALVTKYIAAYATQKSFGYTSNERSLIFGLSGAHAAATLAVVLVGYNIILGYDDAGAPIRLLDATILNATIVIIFVTCSFASITAQRGAQKMATTEAIDLDSANEEEDSAPHILLPFNSLTGINELIALTNLIAPKKSPLTVASVVSDAKDEDTQVALAKKIFDKSMKSAASSERMIETLLRYDVSYSNAISNIIRENNMSDLVINIDTQRSISPSVISKFIDGSAHNSSVTTFLYRSLQPIATIRRQRIILPPHVELEIGFKAWVIRVWSLLKATGATAEVYAAEESIDVLRKMNEKSPVPINLHSYSRYRDMLMVARDLKVDDGLIIVLSRKQKPSYNNSMENIPHYLNSYFADHNLLLIYPYQSSSAGFTLESGMTTEGSINAVGKIEDIIESVIGVTKKSK
ncbi:MAG: cation:proton antiporter [Rikenellaceae bacterium]